MSRLDDRLDAEPGLPLVGHHTMLTAGNLSLDLRAGVATVSGTHVPLSPREVGVLEALLLCRCRPLKREQLLRYLYDGASYAVNPRIVDVFVCTLSRKLRIAGIPELIETVPEQGYMIAHEA